MALDIRIAQFFKLTASNGQQHYYQNYFANETINYKGVLFNFAPFQAQGTTASLNGDNNTLQILFPNVNFAVQLLYGSNSNRLSVMELTTQWLTAENTYAGTALTEYYIGVGSSISETTLELRFRSSIDSVSSNFPNRTLTRELAGILPMESQLILR
jgi:phage-related protein